MIQIKDFVCEREENAIRTETNYENCVLEYLIF